MNAKGLICKIICSFCLFIGAFPAMGQAAESQIYPILLKKGSRGGSVEELQGRLKYLGLFRHHVTGYYGDITKSSVARFQSKFRIKLVDGIAGNKTWDTLRKVTTKYKHKTTPSKKNIPKTSNGFTSAEKKLMAVTVYAEARGEKYEGQVAVANIILNRVKSDKFPGNTVSGVVYQKGAFSCITRPEFRKGKYDESAMKAVEDAISGWNLVDGALFYYNPKKAPNNKYMNSLPTVKWIGNHKFCKSK